MTDVNTKIYKLVLREILPIMVESDKKRFSALVVNLTNCLGLSIALGLKGNKEAINLLIMGLENRIVEIAIEHADEIQAKWKGIKESGQGSVG